MAVNPLIHLNVRGDARAALAWVVDVAVEHAAS